MKWISLEKYLEKKKVEKISDLDMSGERARMPDGEDYVEGILTKDAQILILDNHSKLTVDQSTVQVVDFDPFQDEYIRFLNAKSDIAHDYGKPIAEGIEINPICKPHQVDSVRWGVMGGRRAFFHSFGLGKTITQLEVERVILEQEGSGMGLVVGPYGVSQEFKEGAKMLDISIKQIKSDAEAQDDGIYFTNYESVRDGKVDPKRFLVTSLDEAAVLRGFGKTLTFRNFMEFFHGIKYKFVATATPSPNRYIEILAYAAYLEIMTINDAKTRFFKRDSVKADNLTLMANRENEFWEWVASWALFVELPSDLGHSDEGYALPEMNVHWHMIDTDNDDEPIVEKHTNQLRLPGFNDAAIDLQAAAKEKRDTIGPRIDKAIEIIESYSNEESFVLWHHREAERAELEKRIKGSRSAYGTQKTEVNERVIIDFSNGHFRFLNVKPQMYGAGCNLQRHCHIEIFVGIDFKFYDIIQAIHRVYRFGQKLPVDIHLVYTSAETRIRRELERKWEEHKVLVDKLSKIVRSRHLTDIALKATSVKKTLIENVREEVTANARVVNNDCIIHTRTMESDSIGLGVTSIPFANQYSYSTNLSCFGQTRDFDHFWRQMDFLTPELYRVTKPGRIFCVHVKDRVMFGGITGMGFATLHALSDECRGHFEKHGWGYVARITVVTDVVRENNQTYRLGWTDKCKDGTSRGHGVPEYVLVFRKPPTDRGNGFADERVVIDKPFVEGPDGEMLPFDRDGRMVPESGYSRGKWQFDAHGFWRSSGERLLAPEDFDNVDHDLIFKMFKNYTLNEVYDHKKVIDMAEYLEKNGKLPVKFMLLQPQSWHPEVWADVTRMRGLNSLQATKGSEQHVCPFPIDIVERLILSYSNKGDVVYDPFGGIGTTAVTAIKLERKAESCELNEVYFDDSVAYINAEENRRSYPKLFDLLEMENEDEQ